MGDRASDGREIFLDCGRIAHRKFFSLPISATLLREFCRRKNLWHPTAYPVLKRVYYESAVWLLYLSAR